MQKVRPWYGEIISKIGIGSESKNARVCRKMSLNIYSSKSGNLKLEPSSLTLEKWSVEVKCATL